MSNADGATTTTKNPRHHRRAYTGFGEKDLKKEIAKWPKETLALWEKYGAGEPDGSYLI